MTQLLDYEIKTDQKNIKSSIDIINDT